VNRLFATLVGVVLMAVTLAGVSLATGPVSAQAPDARLAVSIFGGDTTGQFQVLRTKGVVSVTNPATGFFCITPSSTTMKLNRIVPLVSLDGQGTPNSDTTALWSSLNVVCPNSAIEVQSFLISTRSSRNRVGFNVVVI
jgi:hypothetical protein